MEVSNDLEVWVLHGVLWTNSFSVVISEHLSKQVKCLVTDERVILWVDEFLPRLAGMSSQNVIIVLVQSQIILFKIGHQVVSTQNLCDLYKLVIIVGSLEEWLLLEDESSEHATQGPNIK